MNKDMKKMSFKLNKFDMSQIRSDNVVVMIGKRGTGKSSLVKDLLYYHQDIPAACVISATEAANGFYGDFIPSIFIHDEFQPEIIKNVLKRQKNQIDKINEQEEYLGKGRSKINPYISVILDDCLYDSSWTKDKGIRSIFMNGRHHKILFLVTMQYPLGITPTLRSNVDYVFILRENIVSNRKRIYENYAGMFPSFDIFSQIMDQTTEDYGCLVINNTSKSNKIEDQVFWYKADMSKSEAGFKMCDQSFWNYSQIHRQQIQQQRRDGTSYDQNKELKNMLQKKNLPKINIRKEEY